MKHFTRYLLTVTIILLGIIKVTAQTECANIEWMRFFNSSNNFYCAINHMDSSGNAIVSGFYEGSPSIGNINLPASTSLLQNAFIGKLDSTGNPLWIHTAKTFSNSYESGILNPMVDSSGYIYTTIDFMWKTEFNGVTYIGNPPKVNALFVKMNQQGQVLDTFLIKNISGYVFNFIHIDQSENIYGYVELRDTLALGGQSFVSHGNIDYLVFKLNDQFQLQWAQQIGGSHDDIIDAFCIDKQDNIYLSGRFNSSTLVLGGTQLSNPFWNIGSTSETFITKIKNNGQYDWSTKVGVSTTPTYNFVSDMAIDSNGNIYLSSRLNGAIELGPNSVSSFPNGKYNSLLVKYKPATQQFTSLILRGGESFSQSLLYIEKNNTLVWSGNILRNDTVDFIIDSVTAFNNDYYVLGVDLTETLNPIWVIHSRGPGSAWAGRASSWGTSVLLGYGGLWSSLTKDLNGNIYLSGVYADTFASSIFGNYTFPTIPGNNNNIFNGYQAKLGFLSREVTVDNGVLTARSRTAPSINGWIAAMVCSRFQALRNKVLILSSRAATLYRSATAFARWCPIASVLRAFQKCSGFGRSVSILTR